MRHSTENLPQFLQKALRQQMNDLADHIAGGACTTFEEYKKLCGIIEGLAIAERELLDLTKEQEED